MKCLFCGREIFIVRTLTGPNFKGGRYDVWVHSDTGYGPCDQEAHGIDMWSIGKTEEQLLNRKYATPAPEKLSIFYVEYSYKILIEGFWQNPQFECFITAMSEENAETAVRNMLGYKLNTGTQSTRILDISISVVKVGEA